MVAARPDKPPRPWPPAATDALAIVLTMTSGGVDAACVLRLGGVFGSVITGNLVLLGASAKAAAAVLAAPAVALCCYAAGVLAAAPIAREYEREHDATHPGWPTRVIVCLGIEFAVLAALCAGWLATGGRPRTPVTLVLLGVAAAGMGIQSAAVRRLGELSTTYLTGTLTGLLAALAVGKRPERPWRSAGVLGAVVAGAAGTALATALAPGLVPVVVLTPLGVVICAALALGRRAKVPARAGPADAGPPGT